MKTGFVSINECNIVRNMWIALVSFVDRFSPAFFFIQELKEFLGYACPGTH